MKLADWINDFIRVIAPKYALQRQMAREQLRYYEAAMPSKYRSNPIRGQSADLAMERAGVTLVNWARWLEENFATASAILDYHESSIVGPKIAIEPMVKRKNGELYERINKELAWHFERWGQAPTVTRDVSFAKASRLIARHWVRDGEIFTRHIAPFDDGQSEYPYAIQLIPCDYCPMDAWNYAGDPDVVQGVRKDLFNRPIAYIFYRQHPNDIHWNGLGTPLDTFEVSADEITHLKFFRRVEQTRGVTILHNVIIAMDDVKECLDAERIASTISASNAFYIRKSEEYAYAKSPSGEARQFPIEPGMVWQNLFPGEEVGAITSNRPNDKVVEFIDGLLKSICAGTMSSYSYVTKNYDGSYSARRQERTENQRNANQLQNDFQSMWLRPVRNNFIDSLLTFRIMRLPRDVDLDTLYDCDLRVEQMPGLDPEKDAKADLYRLQANTISRHQVIRNHGLTPAVVDQQIEEDPLRIEPQTDVQGDAFAADEGAADSEQSADQTDELENDESEDDSQAVA